MKIPRRSLTTWAGLALVALFASACAAGSNSLTQKTEFDTMVPGWESKFGLDWKVAAMPDGQNLLWGRVNSKYGTFASGFRVLAMAVDSSGQVVGQRIGNVPGGVPGYSSVYFQVGPLAAASSYRVTVWDYYYVQDRGKVQ